MNFQRARTQEQVETRQKEIMDSCLAIYTTQGYEAVNFKVISEQTSFTRPAIYNYYKTKEEIFLDVLLEEYLSWADDLAKAFDSNESMDLNAFCRLLSHSIAKYPKMLELLSVHLNSIENNSRMEKLVVFKKEVAQVFATLDYGLDKFFPNVTRENKNEFKRHFIAYIHGLYPTTNHSAKQIEAMKLAGIKYQKQDFKKQCLKGVTLLGALLK